MAEPLMRVRDQIEDEKEEENDDEDSYDEMGMRREVLSEI